MPSRWPTKPLIAQDFNITLLQRWNAGWWQGCEWMEAATCWQWLDRSLSQWTDEIYRCSDHSSNLLRDCCEHPNKHPVISEFSLIVQAAWPALEGFFLPRKNMHTRVSVIYVRGILYMHSERRLITATHGKITCDPILSVLHMLPPSIFLRTLEVDTIVRSIFQKRKLRHRDDSPLPKVILDQWLSLYFLCPYIFPLFFYSGRGFHDHSWIMTNRILHQAMDTTAILFIFSLRYMTLSRVLILSGRYYKIKVELSLSKVLKHTFCFEHETSQTFRKVERVVV